MRQHWGDIVRISRYRNFYPAWVLHYNPRCGVRYWEVKVFSRWLPPSRELCGSLMDLIFHLHHPLSNLPWFRGRGRDFEGRGRGFVGGGHGSYRGQQNASEKGPGNVDIMDVAITSPISVERNLDVLSGHNYLILVLLPRVVLLRVLHLAYLALPRLYCRRRSMIDSDS